MDNKDAEDIKYSQLTSFIYQEDVAGIIMKLINKKGIINIGGKAQRIYDFAKKDNPNVKKNYLKKVKNLKFPKNSSINISKLNKILNK